jgi:hypothetical protein
MPTIITLLLMTVTIALAVTVLPRIYVAFIKAEELHLVQERGLLRELLAEQNAWMMRHLGCGLGALALVWLAKTSPGMGVPGPLSVALAMYAASSLFFAGLESLLAQKISRLLAEFPIKVRAREQDQR